MKEDCPGLKHCKGDNSREIISTCSEGQGILCDLTTCNSFSVQ